jgi:hypothetical protein
MSWDRNVKRQVGLDIDGSYVPTRVRLGLIRYGSVLDDPLHLG